jgi:hypothetical protein
MAMMRAALAFCVVLHSAPNAMALDAPPARPAAAPAKGGGYSLDQYTIASGGGTSDAGAFSISGTIGQPDADPLQPSSGGAFELSGGFWPGVAAAGAFPDTVFADGFEVNQAR